ncbi:MAG: hypothetical protein ACTSVY_11325 [Candidatus Helarchaeota archaeon]
MIDPESLNIIVIFFSVFGIVAGVMFGIMYYLQRKEMQRAEYIKNHVTAEIIETTRDKGSFNLTELVQLQRWDLQELKEAIKILENEKIVKKVETASSGIHWHFID